jgi:transcriptional regulator with XRE-family HTH domain
MKLHEVLTHYRKLNRITFDELVVKTGISKSTLQKVFTGVTANPAFEMVRTIAESMGVSVDTIAAAQKESNLDSIISPAAMELARSYDRLSEASQKLITAVVLFESADVTMKNHIIAELVDHHNEKLQSGSSFVPAARL